MSISKKKLAANRANAQNSTGPTSAAGKEKVSQNRTRHGLCGKFRVLSHENQDYYDELLQALLDAEQPADDAERELVIKMARNTWLSDRAARGMEASFQVRPQSAEDAKAGVHEVAVLKDIDLYMRYQVHADRAYARAAAELIRRRKERELRARGFESQKRAQAEEERRAKREQRADERHANHQERHKIAVAIEKKRLEILQVDSFLRADEAANVINSLPPEQRAQMAQMFG